MEDTLAQGNYTDANVMIFDSIASAAPASWQYDTATGATITDDTNDDNIVANYRGFYYLYSQYMNGAMTGSDTSSVVALANLCPMHDGLVVYQARALYTLVFDSIKVFDDSYCACIPDSIVVDTTGKGYRTANTVKKITTTQQYTLYPDPNDGNITILQSIADIEPMQIQVWNEIGKQEFKKQLCFTEKKLQLQLKGLNEGVYILLITDSKGTTNSIKFTVH